MDHEENSLNLKCLINCIQAEVCVKLCAYRNLFKATRIDQGLSFYRGMVAANPAHLSGVATGPSEYGTRTGCAPIAGIDETLNGE